MDVHAVLQHSSVGPCLIKVGSYGIGTVATDDNAPHAALLERFGYLPEELLWMFGVRVNNDDFSDVLFPHDIDGRQENQILFAACRRRVRAVHVNDGCRPSGDH